MKRNSMLRLFLNLLRFHFFPLAEHAMVFLHHFLCVYMWTDVRNSQSLLSAQMILLWKGFHISRH